MCAIEDDVFKNVLVGKCLKCSIVCYAVYTACDFYR